MTETTVPEGVELGDWLGFRDQMLAIARAGFASPSMLRTAIDEWLSEGALDFADVAQPLRDELHTHIIATIEDEQAAATGESDSGRLDRAFAAMEDEGILARMNFACCTGCGHAEIENERQDGGPWRGYVFFHRQDSTRLGEGGDLCLAWGDFRPEEQDDEHEGAEAQARIDAERTAIAHRIVALLRAEGLDASWNEDIAAGIGVSISAWNRRMPQD